MRVGMPRLMRNLNERGICASAFMNVYCADVYKICAQAMFATLWQIRRFYNSLTSVPGQQRKSLPTFLMSVKPPKADIARMDDQRHFHAGAGVWH